MDPNKISYSIPSPSNVASSATSYTADQIRIVETVEVTTTENSLNNFNGVTIVNSEVSPRPFSPKPSRTATSIKKPPITPASRFANSENPITSLVDWLQQDLFNLPQTNFQETGNQLPPSQKRRQSNDTQDTHFQHVEKRARPTTSHSIVNSTIAVTASVTTLPKSPAPFVISRIPQDAEEIIELTKSYIKSGLNAEEFHYQKRPDINQRFFLTINQQMMRVFCETNLSLEDFCKEKRHIPLNFLKMLIHQTREDFYKSNLSPENFCKENPFVLLEFLTKCLQA